jgi:glycosyltransferase involved in cell wall biosynthesis
MKPFSILLHIRASGGGGAERVFAMLANGLSERGHKVTLAVDLVIDADQLLPAVELVDLGPGHGCGVRRLAGLIRHGGYDALLSGVAVSNVKMAAAKVLAPSLAPLILSYHGFREYRTGKISAVAYYGLPLLSLIASRFVCVSKSLERTLVSEWHAPKKHTSCLYNPVDLPPLSVTAADIAARPPVIGAVGRLSKEKGMDALITAFARMKTPGVSLSIGGEGPERARLERMIDDLDLTGRVRLFGPTNGPASVFGGARVAAVPSRTEAFGMTTVEALAHGLPVVACDCDGPREILDDGRYGTLVPIDDPDAMAAALDAALATSHDPAPGLARAAEFSLARGLDAWEGLISDVIARR